RLAAGDRRRAASDGLVSGELIVDAFLDVRVRFRRFSGSRRFFRLLRLLLRRSLSQSECCRKQKRKGQGNHFPHGLFSYWIELLFHVWVWDRLLQLNWYSVARVSKRLPQRSTACLRVRYCKRFPQASEQPMCHLIFGVDEVKTVAIAQNHIR